MALVNDALGHIQQRGYKPANSHKLTMHNMFALYNMKQTGSSFAAAAASSGQGPGVQAGMDRLLKLAGDKACVAALPAPTPAPPPAPSSTS
eukprot:2993912-Karenia_brevis.AAC.1